MKTLIRNIGTLVSGDIHGPVDFIDSAMDGGVTTAISVGEVHLPGRPNDIVGLKALAIVAAKAYANFRPGGVKVHAGADPRAGHGRAGLRRHGRRGGQARRRDLVRVREDGQGRGARVLNMISATGH